jgi:hypothetical protein
MSSFPMSFYFELRHCYRKCAIRSSGAFSEKFLAFFVLLHCDTSQHYSECVKKEQT